MSTVWLLAQEADAASRDWWLFVGVVIGLIAGAGAVTLLHRRERSRLAAAAQAGVQAQSEAAEVHRQRENIAFEQHRQMNTLAIEKLKLELQALQTQLRMMEADIRRRSDASEVHETMLHKTRLEVESLKLHIREQRKRLDDYGQFEE
jgi:hypothetical protein